MPGLLLTDEERARFVGWLENEIASGEAMMRQFETMGEAAAPIFARERAETLAAKVLLAKLRSYERQEISR